jgi:hypothetical protein
MKYSLQAELSTADRHFSRGRDQVTACRHDASQLSTVRDYLDRLYAKCTVVYWSDFLATDPEVRIQFPELPYFLRSSGSGTLSTQPSEYT